LIKTVYKGYYEVGIHKVTHPNVFEGEVDWFGEFRVCGFGKSS